MEFSSGLFEFVFNQAANPLFVVELTKRGDIVLVKGNLAFSNFFQLGSKLRLNVPFKELEFPFQKRYKEEFYLHLKSVAQYEIPASQEALSVKGNLPYRIQFNFAGEEELGQKKRVAVLIQEQKIAINLRPLSRIQSSTQFAFSHFSDLYDALDSEGVVVVNMQGTILFVNQYVESNYQVVKESVVGVDISSLVMPQSNTAFYVSQSFDIANIELNKRIKVIFTLNGIYNHVWLKATKILSQGEELFLLWITPAVNEELGKSEGVLNTMLSTVLTSLPILVFQVSDIGIVESLTKGGDSDASEKYSNLRNKLMGCLAFSTNYGCGNSATCDLCTLRVGLQRCFEDKRDVAPNLVSLRLKSNDFDSQVVNLKVGYTFIKGKGVSSSVVVLVEVEPKSNLMPAIKPVEEPIELLRTIVSKNSVITISQEGTIVSVDEPFLALTGYSASDLLGKSFFKLILGYKRSFFYNSFKRSTLYWSVLKEEESEGNMEIYNRDGSSLIVTYTVAFQKVETQKKMAVLTINYNAPSEEGSGNLYSSLNKFKIALDSHHIGMWEITWPSQIVTVSDKWRKISGITESNLTFKSFVNDYVVFEQRERVMTNFKRFVDGLKGHYHDEFQIQHQTKGAIWIRNSATVIQRSIEGNPIDIVGFIEDITSRKATEEDLLRKEANFRNLTENIPGVAFRCLDDHRWTSLFFSEAIVELTGHYAHEYITFDRHFSQDILPEFLPLNRSNTKESKGREVYEVEYKIKDRNGRIKWVNERGRYIYNKRGKLIYLDGYIQDVTAQREREETIKRINQHLELIINSANVGLWEQNLITKKIEFNTVFFKTLGYINHPTKITNSEFLHLIHPEDLAKVQVLHREYITGLVNFYQIESRLRCYDGSYKWFLSTGKLVVDEGDKQPAKMVGVMQDIDSYKQAQLSMALIQSRILSFIESTDSMVWMVDNEFRIVYANQRFLEVMRNLYGLDLKIGDDMTDQSLLFNADFWKSVFLEVISATGNKTFTSELYYMGKLVTMEYSMYTTMHNHEAIGITCMAHDITYLKESEDKMIQEASENRVMSNFGAFLATEIDDLSTVATYIVKNITEILSSEFSCVVYAEPKSDKLKLTTNNEIVLNCSARTVAEGLLEGFGVNRGFAELNSIQKPTYKEVHMSSITSDKSRFVIESLGLTNVFVCPVMSDNDKSIAWLIFATSNNSFSLSELEVIKHVADLFAALGTRLNNKKQIINTHTDYEELVRQKCKKTNSIAVDLKSKSLEIQEVSEKLKEFVLESGVKEYMKLVRANVLQINKLAEKLDEMTKEQKSE